MPNVLVTGASRGIGLAIAGRLADSGFTVIALARTQGEALTAAIDGLASRLGGIDVSVANAGIATGGGG